MMMDAVLDAVPEAEPTARLYAPPGHDRAKAGALRAQGWVVLAGLNDGADSTAEARRLGCSHRLDDAQGPVALD